MLTIVQQFKYLLTKFIQQNVEDFLNPKLSQEQRIASIPDKVKENNPGGLKVVDPVFKRSLPKLQEQIDSQPDNITLTLWPPNYEYQEPIIINRSIILDGQGATICGHKGPIFSIQSDGVILRNFRIEVIGEQDSNNLEDNCAILIKSGQNLQFHNIEVRGTVMGIPEEEGVWRYPNPLYLGELPHGRECDLLLRIVVPVACKIASDVCVLQFEPQNLTPGPNEVRLHVEKLPKDTLIDGSIFLLSTFLKRRINLTAHIVSLQEEQILSNQNRIVWQPENWSSFVSTQELQSQPSESESILIGAQNLTPILPSTESKIPRLYPQFQDKVQQSQTSPLQQPKIRRGEQPNNEVFKLPDRSEVSVDVKPDSNNFTKVAKPQIPQIFIQNEETFSSEIFSTESTSIPVKKYQVGSAFSLPNQDNTSKSDIDTKQDSPQPPIHSLFLDQNSNSQQNLSKQDELPETSSQVSPLSIPSSSCTSSVRSQPINPLFRQTLTCNQPLDEPNEEIKQKSLQKNDSSQLPKRKIIRSNEISPLFENGQ